MLLKITLHYFKTGIFRRQSAATDQMYFEAGWVRRVNFVKNIKQ